MKELERKARKTHDIAAVLEASPTHMTNQYNHAMAAWDYHVAARPSVMLALLARMRELEDALDGCGDYSRYGDRIRSVLEKGVVLE